MMELRCRRLHWLALACLDGTDDLLQDAHATSGGCWLLPGCCWMWVLATGRNKRRACHASVHEARWHGASRLFPRPEDGSKGRLKTS